MSYLMTTFQVKCTQVNSNCTFLTSKSLKNPHHWKHFRSHHQKKQENSNNAKSTLNEIFSGTFLKPFSCAGVLWMIYTISGPDTVQIYLIYILEESKSSIEANIGPMISGSIGLFCAGTLRTGINVWSGINILVEKILKK